MDKSLQLERIIAIISVGIGVISFIASNASLSWRICILSIIAAITFLALLIVEILSHKHRSQNAIPPIHMISPNSGIKRVLSRDESPLEDKRKLVELIKHSENITLIGTGLTNLSRLLEDKDFRCDLKDAIIKGNLRIEIFIIDPSYESYLTLRAKELDNETFRVKEKNLNAFDKIMGLKAECLKSDLTNSELKKVMDNLIVGTYKSIPRVAFLKFDDCIYIRPYVGVGRGGDSPFLLELDNGNNQAYSAYPIFMSEIDRIRRCATERFIKATNSKLQVEYNEHREVIHRCAFLHDTLHLICYDRTGDVYLQLRSNAKGRNPLCWTSTVSGHIEVQDGKDYTKAMKREAEEELDERTYSLISKETLLGSTLIESSGEIKSGEFKWKHVCRSNSFIFSALLDCDGLNDQKSVGSNEVLKLCKFPVDRIKASIASEGTLVDDLGIAYRLADNFASVFEFYLEKHSL